ncbi:MAG: phytase [Nocardioidaceae bacterium]
MRVALTRLLAAVVVIATVAVVALLAGVRPPWSTAGPPPPAAAAAPGATARVLPLVETDSFAGTGDVADDAAIWVDPDDPARSVVVADDKSERGGGIGVFGMDGRLLQFRADGMIGNVDLRSGFPTPTGPVVLVGANNRTNDTLALWVLDTSTRRLSPVVSGRIATLSPSYGFCMYHSPRSGRFYAFVTPKGSGSIQQFELSDDGAGKVAASLVRTLRIGSTAESCVADDETGRLYVGEEDVAVWRFGAEPTAGADAVSVDTVGAGHLEADIEGMTIAYGSGGSGYLVVSSQGDSTIALYDRAGHEFVRTVRLVANGGIDAVTESDGLDVTTLNAGPGFEGGLLVVHDGSNADGTTSNLKYVPWSAVAP